ncbi:MAG: S8/S53 family peptidase, partial [Bacteroidales bacterium]|nr:S8/S53 family peptidase [Bacteroidales bacterium]
MKGGKQKRNNLNEDILTFTKRIYMKKFAFLLCFCFIFHFSQVLCQTTHYLQNGTVIYEKNGNLLDITRGDSIRILKDLISIKYSSSNSEHSIASIENLNNLVRYYTCQTGWIIYNVPDTNNIITLSASLLTQIDSSKIGFNYPLTFFSSIPSPPVPDDPEYENQWYLNDIHIPEVWEITTGNPEIKVGILDCGTDWDNDDIGPDNNLGYNFMYGSSNTKPSDWLYDHGTMISSIIAAKTNNNLGQSGITGGWGSPPAKIVMCVIGNDMANGILRAAAALDWALLQGVRLFNFSWGVSNLNDECSCGQYEALRAEVDLAYDTYGATMFSSTGNTKGQGEVAWPGCGNKVIAVGATNNAGGRWMDPHNGQGSSYGANTDISAPGDNIIAPYVIGNPAAMPPGKLYGYYSGTSFATAIAVGVTALMLSVNPCLSNVDIQYILQTTADKTGSYDYNWDPTRPGHSQQLGYGKINAYQAVLMASEQITEVASNENLTFNTPKWFTHNLTLRPNSTLTITSTVKFNEGCKIIVMPGAQLIINGGTLTSTCPGFWQGIEVQGNDSLAQIPISNQGYVHIYNHGKIERANPGIYSVNGGIVVAHDAVFNNNQRAVIIANYPGWNYSNFKRCTFSITNGTGISGYPYFIGAELVKPIEIVGCTFENSANMAYPDRGIGVVSLDAEIYIVAQQPSLPNYPDTIKSVFSNLAYGIYSMHSSSQYSLHVSDAIFHHNQKGVYLSGYNGSSYAIVTTSKFIVLDPGLPDGTPTTYGMYLDNCTGYSIEENKFYCNSETNNGYGLIINESGTNDNEIYNNTFHHLQFGSQAQGCNRYSDHGDGGLCYKCNDFFMNTNDIVIISDAAQGTPNQGISIYQGNKSQAAKNTFTVGNNNGYDINNPFDQIFYFYDQYSNNYNITPDPTIGVQNVAVKYSYYVKNTDCPSHLNSTPDVVGAVASMTEANNEADSLQTILSGLVDGGSTEELVSTVQMSTPLEAVQTTNNLLSQSPYLSDSVMKVAISKENVLPNAMIRDILVENPQSSKSDAVIQALDQRFITMPDSMMTQIMEGQNIIGAKEDKEQELTKWNHQYSGALKQLVRVYNEDSTGIYGVDSLISLITKDGSLNSRYDLVSLYYSKGMFETGNTILNNIPSNYILSGNLEIVHNMYVSLFPILQQISTDTTGLESIDSSQIATLQTLAIHTKTLPGAYARNILIKKGALQYEEPV